jgi:hypothetical protein
MAKQKIEKNRLGDGDFTEPHRTFLIYPMLNIEKVKGIRTWLTNK